MTSSLDGMTTPTFPAGVATVRVRGTFLRPDGSPHTGRIDFTAPGDLVLDPDHDESFAGTSTAYLDDDGAIDVLLVASDSPNINPSGWTYRIAGVLSGNPLTPRHLPLWAANPEVDLVEVLPVNFDPGEAAPVVITIMVAKDGQPRFTGNGPPGTIIGAEPGDEYLDNDSGTIYRLT